MADIVDVSEAIRERLQPVLPEWNVKFFEPSPIPVPAVCIEGDPSKATDMAEGWGNFTKWQLNVTLFATAVDQESAVRKLGPLVGTDGPIVQALLDEDINDALAELTRKTGHYVQASTVSGWRIVRRNRVRYRSAVIAVTVGTN